MFRFRQGLRSCWYNRSWHNIDDWAQHPAVRFTVVIPVIGWFILFNDDAAGSAEFKIIVDSEGLFLLPSALRLQLVYLGLLFIAASVSSYYWFRPSVLKKAKNQQDAENSFQIRCLPRWKPPS